MIKQSKTSILMAVRNIPNCQTDRVPGGKKQALIKITATSLAK
jgi:hypothetical protein